MRRLLPVLSISAAFMLLATALTPACGDECNKKSDCATGEVCNAGLCEQLSQGYVSCASDDDCDPNGQFVCRSARCTLAGTNQPPPMGDAGIIDAGDVGMVDMGIVDAGMVDLGVRDAGTSSTSSTADGGMGDAGMSDSGMAGPADGGLGPTGERVNATINASVQYTEADSTINALYSGSGVRTDINATGTAGGPNDGHRMIIRITGMSTGSFSCGTPRVGIEYRDPAGNVFAADENVGTCTITVSSYGAVGGRIQGTITGQAQQILAGTTPPDDLTPTISGDFDVIRDMDSP